MMDFEVYRHVSGSLGCIVRGGMCMPFHLPDAAKRLSIDIDLMTPGTLDDVRDAMVGIDAMDELACKEYHPSNPYPLDNLITYKVSYDSCLGGRGSVKVDFLCESGLPLSTRTVPLGTTVFGFSTTAEMNILSKGALLADKITTLALGTIGLKPTRQTEIAKQIYDIAALMRLSDKHDIREAVDIFPRLTGFKTAHFHSPKYAVDDIVQNISCSVDGFLDLTSAVSITAAQAKRHSDFQGTYISKDASYKKTRHVSDILLIKILIQHVGGIFDGTRSADASSASMHGIISKINDMENNNISDPASEAESCRNSMPDSVPFNKNILNGATPEHVYLMKELYA